MLPNHSNQLKKKLFVILIFVCLVSCSPFLKKAENSPSLHIHDIQGCSHISDYDGHQVHDITGIVTSKTTKGFYMQDDQPDDLVCSSEAIFVFTNSYSKVMPGDKVLVSGLVNEFFPGDVESNNLSITEIEDPEVKIVAHNHSIPEATVIGDGGREIPDSVIDNDCLTSFDVDDDGIDFFESMESMIVRINSGVVVGARNAYNEVVIVPESAIHENLVSKNGALIQTESDPNPERIILNMNDSNMEKINVGAKLIHPVQGILDYSYGNFKVNTFGKVDFNNSEFQITPIENDGNLLSVASYNVNNLSRFDEKAKFRNLARIIVKTMDSPDVVILHEIMDDSGVEDDGTVTAELTISRILEVISEAGGPVYSYIQIDPKDGNDGGISGGNIRSVILYRSDKQISVAEDDLPALLNSNPDVIESTSASFSGTRKPLAVLFNKGEKQLMLIAVHLTSRNADSPLFGSYQPIIRPEEVKRIHQAELIHDFVDKFHKMNPDIRIVVAGDLNDDPWSKTLLTLTSTTMNDLATIVPPNERYSFILDGNAIQLDYILTEKPISSRDQFFIFHTNSLYDYLLKFSDHDPVLALIDLNDH